MNQFRDNPYQSPEPIVRAELVERPYQPPRVAVKKNWPPVFSILWLVAGPFASLVAFRYCGHQLGLFTIDDEPIFAMFYLFVAISWLIAGVRVGAWLIRSLCGY